MPLARRGHARTAHSHQTALGSGTITGGLTDFTVLPDLSPLDHDQRNTLIRIIMREALALLTVGLIAGTLASAWLTRFLVSRLFGVSRLDAASFVGAIACATAVLLLAAIPACRRAARLRPAAMLRE